MTEANLCSLVFTVLLYFPEHAGAQSNISIHFNSHNKDMLIISMLNGSGVAKGDIKQNSINTGVKWKCLQVESRARAFICAFCHRKRNMLLAPCRRPFVEAEQSASDAHPLTHRFTFHSSAISTCQSLHCTSSGNKGSCWHADCLRGVIHHHKRKGGTG